MDWHGIDMESAIQQLKDLMREHGMKVVVTLVVSFASSIWGWIWARRKWKSRQDTGVIHYSQSSFVDCFSGPERKLMGRTLVLDVYAENQLKDEISHPIARKLIRRAADKTTVDQPFLLFPEDDRWYVLNIIRLAIAEQFRAGAAAKLASKASVQVVNCVFAITFERYPQMKQGKIRVMIVKRDVLENKNFFDEIPINYESPSHAERITTLRKMQEDYLTGNDGGKWMYCMDVRLSIQV